MAILYRHIRLDKNEPFYIGIGKDEKRAFTRFSRNKYWKKIVNKTDYEVQILFDDLTWEEACEKEKEFIALYGKKNSGGILCNITDGGEGFLGKHSDETKMKISKQKKGNNFWVGKKHSQESKDKISQSKKGHSVNKGKSHPAWNKNISKVDMVKVMEMLDNNITQTKIAEFFNTDQGTISRYIKKYRNSK
jgi:hypothetical protein